MTAQDKEKCLTCVNRHPAWCPACRRRRNSSNWPDLFKEGNVQKKENLELRWTRWKINHGENETLLRTICNDIAAWIDVKVDELAKPIVTATLSVGTNATKDIVKKTLSGSDIYDCLLQAEAIIKQTDAEYDGPRTYEGQTYIAVIDTPKSPFPSYIGVWFGSYYNVRQTASKISGVTEEEIRLIRADKKIVPRADNE